MSRKHFIEIAESCIDAIKRGYVKKKDIEDFINSISKGCYRCNSNFNYDRFEQYIMERI